MTLKELLEQEFVSDNVEIYADCKDYGYGPYLDKRHVVGKILRQVIGQPVTAMQVLDLEAKTGIDLLNREVLRVCGVGVGKVAIAVK